MGNSNGNRARKTVRYTNNTPASRALGPVNGYKNPPGYVPGPADGYDNSSFQNGYPVYPQNQPGYPVNQPGYPPNQLGYITPRQYPPNKPVVSTDPTLARMLAQEANYPPNLQPVQGPNNPPLAGYQHNPLAGYQQNPPAGYSQQPLNQPHPEPSSHRHSHLHHSHSHHDHPNHDHPHHHHHHHHTHHHASKRTDSELKSTKNKDENETSRAPITDPPPLQSKNVIDTPEVKKEVVNPAPLPPPPPAPVQEPPTMPPPESPRGPVAENFQKAPIIVINTVKRDYDKKSINTYGSGSLSIEQRTVRAADESSSKWYEMGYEKAITSLPKIST